MSTAASSRLHDLELHFESLDEQLEDSPVKDALSTLHAIIHEVGRDTAGGRFDDSPSMQSVADLYLQAPPMGGPAESSGLPVGSVAPLFELPDANGDLVRLADYAGHVLVLVFYPLDWSPGCSRQLDLYQQEIDEFRDRGAEIVAISVDSIYSHGAWSTVRGIEFPLLSDFHPKGEVARAYNVWRDSDGFSDRAIYVIGADGTIRYSHVSPQVDHIPDIYELFGALDELIADG